ncbi:MAG: response regulator [Phycisphaerae bacterium]|nr:response regulator [Phycisphaerae bacterium]
MPEEKKTILLVDDDEEILAAMEATIRQFDVKIERATNGNQAVDKVEKVEPDLVVLDMMLPRKSGFLVMERIRSRRQQQKSEKPYVIMVTANPGQRHKQYAQSLGVNEYLNKPFRMDRLTDAISKLLQIEKKSK